MAGYPGWTPTVRLGTWVAMLAPGIALVPTGKQGQGSKLAWSAPVDGTLPLPVHFPGGSCVKVGREASARACTAQTAQLPVGRARHEPLPVQTHLCHTCLQLHPSGMVRYRS